MQNNDFRSATNLHSLGRARSDNTFASATNLGRIRANATRASLRASSTVGKSDRADFYKFTVAPGVNLPFGSANYQLRKSSVTFSVYVEVVGRRRFASKFTLQKGPTSVADNLVNSNQLPFTVYLKVETRASEAQYNFRLNYFR
jgi:hypothetical protein